MSKTNYEHIFDLKDKLREKKLFRQTPGEILQGVALGIYHQNPDARRLYKQAVEGALQTGFNLIDDVLTIGGISPSIKKDFENRKIHTQKTLHTLILEDLRNRSPYNSSEEIKELNSLLNRLEQKLKSPPSNWENDVFGLYTLYDDFSVFGSSVREKEEEKIIDKVALNLAAAYALSNGSEFKEFRNMSKYGKPSVNSYIEKSKLEDLCGCRIITTTPSSALKYVEETVMMEDDEGLKVDIGSRSFNGGKRIYGGRLKFLMNQKDKKYNAFGKPVLSSDSKLEDSPLTAKEDQYRAWHMHMQKFQIPTEKVEVQIIPLLWYLNNETHKKLAHDSYDNIIKKTVMNLKKEEREHYLKSRSNLRKFFDMRIPNLPDFR